ncbi:hypothetical protein F2Q68_00034178 [Brassica cretica]|uniref:Uncharacterized protein n=1 Tax=Brassica cretica TaxID=69181 RepID=A0A8S9GYR4_BRACR|nr:hypothetical protein F2Q68_00034178 [Brassica cretica]
MIRLRLFKTDDVFVGANRRTGCRVVIVSFGQFVRIVSNFNLATSRSCFEDFTYIFGAEERLFCDFGPDEANDKSLNCSFPDIPVELWCRLWNRVEFRHPKHFCQQTMLNRLSFKRFWPKVDLSSCACDLPLQKPRFALTCAPRGSIAATVFGIPRWLRLRYGLGI